MKLPPLDFYSSLLAQSLLVTGFVLLMMMLVEYVNVRTRGRWERQAFKKGWRNAAWGSGLGVIPGCLGSYVGASLFLHRVFSLGGLTAVMLVTVGDEAFVMLTLFPKETLTLLAVLAVLGLMLGIVVDKFYEPGNSDREGTHETPLHAEETCGVARTTAWWVAWRKPSFLRLAMLLGLLGFLFAVLKGWVGHEHLMPQGLVGHAEHVHHEACLHDHSAGAGDSFGLTVFLVFMTLLSVYVVAVASDHFLREHWWDHILRMHGLRIFLWTFAAFFLTRLLLDHVDIAPLLQEHRWSLLLLAAVVGLIPESGPHLLFVGLFAEGAIPFSVLLTNAIVQDGHGLIPVLAHSRKTFVQVKLIKFIVALGVGGLVELL